jgi:MbtH protein
VVYGEETRKNCLEYVSTHWTDMRPASLIKEMDDELRLQRSRVRDDGR